MPLVKRPDRRRNRSGLSRIGRLMVPWDAYAKSAARSMAGPPCRRDVDGHGNCIAPIRRSRLRVSGDLLPASARNQCERNTGTGGRASMLLVAPPKMNSRTRECP